MTSFLFNMLNVGGQQDMQVDLKFKRDQGR